MPRMPKSQKPADPFDALPNEFKDMVEASDADAIRTILAQVALNEEENNKARDADEDLAVKVAAKKAAGLKYSEATKINNLRIKSRKMLLDNPASKMSKDDLKKEISEIVLAELQNLADKAEDPELARATEDAKEAAEGYKEASKMNKLKILYCRRVLGDKGGI